MSPSKFTYSGHICRFAQFLYKCWIFLIQADDKRSKKINVNQTNKINKITLINKIDKVNKISKSKKIYKINKLDKFDKIDKIHLIVKQ